MKNRWWIVIFSSVIVVCIVVWFLISGDPAGNAVGIYRDGVLIETIDLGIVTEPYDITIEGDVGSNIVHVEKDRIFVAYADCPDNICVKHGALDSGDPIVCLPNRLVIKWLRDNSVNAVVG